MGPEATAEFYLKIIRLFQKKYNCINDQDYPEIFIYNLPLPDVVDKVEDKKIVESFLLKGIEKLEAIGSDFIVSPCNTANTYFFSFENIRLPILNLIDLTLSEIIKDKSKKVGILGTKQTTVSNAYQVRLKNKSIDFSVPTEKEQEIITKIILNLLSGKKLKADKKILKNIINRFKQEGCDSIILGCTELPLILKQKDSEIKLFDTLAILAEYTVKFSSGDNYV